MAQHYIYDSKGRISKVLNDKEYAEHQKTEARENKRVGCIVLIIFAIICVFSYCSGSDKTTNKQKKAIFTNAPAKFEEVSSINHEKNSNVTTSGTRTNVEDHTEEQEITQNENSSSQPETAETESNTETMKKEENTLDKEQTND